MLNQEFVICLIAFSLFSVEYSQCFYLQTTLNEKVHYLSTRLVEETQDGATLQVVECLQPLTEPIFENEDARIYTHSAISLILQSDQHFDPKERDWLPIFISGVEIGNFMVKLTYRSANKEKVDVRILASEEEIIGTATVFRDPALLHEESTKCASKGWLTEFRMMQLVEAATGATIIVPDWAQLLIRIDNQSEELWYILKIIKERVKERSIAGLLVAVNMEMKSIFKATINGTDYYADVRKFCDNESKPPTKYLRIGSVKRQDGSHLRLYPRYSSSVAYSIEIQMNKTNNELKNPAISLVVYAQTWATFEPQTLSWSPLLICTVEELPNDNSVLLIYETPCEFSIEIMVSRLWGNDQTIMLGNAIVQGNLAENGTLSNWCEDVIIKWKRHKELTDLTKMDKMKGEHSQDLIFIRECNTLKPEKWRRVVVTGGFVGLGSMVIGKLVEHQVEFWIWTEKQNFQAVIFQATIDELKREITVDDLKKYQFYPAYSKGKKIDLKKYLTNSKNKFAINPILTWDCEKSCISMEIDNTTIIGKGTLSFTYKYAIENF